MERKNIFQLVNENYDIEQEINKINNLFIYEKCFTDKTTGYYCVFKQVVNALIRKWEHAGTCLDVDEFLSKANAKIYPYPVKNPEEVIINNLEALENFLYFVINQLDKIKFSIKNAESFKTFINLIRTLEAEMGLVRKEIDGVVVLYPENAPLEQVINIIDNKDVDWELIRYVREDLSLAEKRKSLAFLATNLNIEKDKEETNPIIMSLMTQTTNILNNLHIRHNNTTGKGEAVLKDISDKEATELCDYAFNHMLNIVLLREQKKYETTYEAFNEKQKQAKNKP